MDRALRTREAPLSSGAPLIHIQRVSGERDWIAARLTEPIVLGGYDPPLRAFFKPHRFYSMSAVAASASHVTSICQFLTHAVPGCCQQGDRGCLSAPCLAGRAQGGETLTYQLTA